MKAITFTLSTVCCAMLITACGKPEEKIATPEPSATGIARDKNNNACPTVCKDDPVTKMTEGMCQLLARSRQCGEVPLQSVLDAAKLNASVKLTDADPAVPFSAYTRIESGDEITALYYKLSGKPFDVDHEAKANNQIKGMRDVFEQKDATAKLGIKYKAIIEGIKETDRYKVMSSRSGLLPYDASAGGFPIDVDFARGEFYYSPDETELHKFVATNGDKFRIFKVTDEAAARKIEADRSKGAYASAKMLSYWYFQATNVTNSVTKAQLVKVDYVDRNGTVLLSLTK